MNQGTVMQSNEPSLTFLPDNVLGHILCQIIDSKQFRDMSSFSRTCRKMNDIYCEIQNTLRKSEIEYEKWRVINREKMLQMTETCDREIEFASQNGDLNILKFFHDNQKKGFTTRAMDFASAYGHLDIVKFLHENRKEGCTESAMNWASWCCEIPT